MGAGVVGLAIAAALVRRVPHLDVVVLERHDGIGRETSSRNSEVVHAGLYYPPGSLKARLCVEGRRELYALAGRHGVPHRKTGKLIAAVAPEEIRSLEALARRAADNGVEGVRLIGAEDVRVREPAVRAAAALLSSETGIVDSHVWMALLAAMAAEGGAALVFGTEVVGLEARRGLWHVRYRDATGGGTVAARAVVNAAGLEAQSVMRAAGLSPAAMGLTGYLCKGEYFTVTGPGRGLVRGLVYPSPEADLVGLGIHTVVDLAGGLRLGPNALYVEAADYTVDPGHRDAFAEAVRPFLPFVASEHLEPAFAGIRAKLAAPGAPPRDFHIAHEHAAGAPGFFNLAGIESPGLTASPAIGRHVAELVAAYLADA